MAFLQTFRVRPSSQPSSSSSSRASSSSDCDRSIQLLQRILEDYPEKFNEMSKVYNNTAKRGTIKTPDKSMQKKITSLIHFNSDQCEHVGLDAYVKQQKEGQNQVFFLANVGQTIEDLMKSAFIKKLTVRGCEVLLLNDGM